MRKQDEEMQRAAQPSDLAHSFGFKAIEPDSKQQKVNQVFHSVADKYDLMNDVMSLRLHRLWKDMFISQMRPHKHTAWHLLDVAGGTGDIAFRALKASNNNPLAKVTLLDINSSMLEVGRQRAEKFNFANQIEFVEGDAQKLPFADNSFDAYSIAFGIRNVPHIDQALSEAYRVLRPGGHFLCLEFSQVDSPLFAKIYDLWSFLVIPNLGQMIAGDKDSYQYLIESIRKFPSQENFTKMIAEANFARSKFTNLTMGVATIFEGWKI